MSNRSMNLDVLDGTVNVIVQVKGDGKVISATSSNPHISTDFKRGRVVGGA